MGQIYCCKCGYVIGEDDSDYDSTSICSSCAEKEAEFLSDLEDDTRN